MKKTKQQFIEEIREILDTPTTVNNFTQAEEFINNSQDEQFIIVVTKQTIKQLSQIGVKLIEIH